MDSHTAHGMLSQTLRLSLCLLNLVPVPVYHCIILQSLVIACPETWGRLSNPPTCSSPRILEDEQPEVLHLRRAAAAAANVPACNESASETTGAPPSVVLEQMLQGCCE